MSTDITTVFVNNPRATDICTRPIADARQMSLNIGNVTVIAGGHTRSDDVERLRLEATAMEAIAAHAQDVADQLLAWADQVEDAQSEAGCSCGWRGRSADVDEHPCTFPDDVDERLTAANDGFLDNADPDMDAAGADDYLAETPA